MLTNILCLAGIVMILVGGLLAAHHLSNPN